MRGHAINICLIPNGRRAIGARSAVTGIIVRASKSLTGNVTNAAGLSRLRRAHSSTNANFPF